MCYVNAQQLKAASVIASKKGTPKTLTGVCVEIGDNDEYMITATDSYSALIINRQEFEKPTKYIINAEPLRHLKGTDLTVELEPLKKGFVKATIHEQYDQREEAWPLIGGRFPKVIQLFEDGIDPNNGTYGIDTNLCEKMCKAIRTAARGFHDKCKARTDYVKVESVSPLKPIRFTATNHQNIEGIVMPVRL